MQDEGHRDLSYPARAGARDGGQDPGDRFGFCGSLAEGDLVQVWPGIACGKCRPCQTESRQPLPRHQDHGLQLRRGLCRASGPAQAVHSRRREPAAPRISIRLLPPWPSPWPAALTARSRPASVRATAFSSWGRAHRRSACPSGRACKERQDHSCGETARPHPPAGKAHQRRCVVDPAEESLESVLAAETGRAGVDVILTATPEVRVDDDLLKMLSPGGRDLHLLRTGSGKLSGTDRPSLHPLP